MAETYRDAIRIDKYELADLWEAHCDKFLDWWEAYSEAKRLRSIAEAKLDLLKKENKEELEYIRSDLEDQIRKKPTDFDLKKTTDIVVANCVIRQPRYRRQLIENREKERKLRFELIEAEHKEQVLKGAAEAFDKRTTALQALTKLMDRGLYSAQLPSGPIKTEIEVKRAEEQHKQLNERMRLRNQEKEGKE